MAGTHSVHDRGVPPGRAGRHLVVVYESLDATWFDRTKLDERFRASGLTTGATFLVVGGITAPYVTPE